MVIEPFCFSPVFVRSAPIAWTPRQFRPEAFGSRIARQEKQDAVMNMERKVAASNFVWDDPFLIADQLTEDERMIRDAAANFAADKLAPRVQEAYLEELTDPGIFKEMGDAGLLG